MTTFLTRRLPQQADHYEWLVIGDNTTQPQQGTLQALAQSAEDANVILLIAAADVLLLEVDLPIKSQSQLKKALPYAVEDLLANEVEQYHFVWCKQPNHKLAVAAIEHETLVAYVQPFQAAAITLTAVYSVALVLPLIADNCSLLLEQQHATVRFSAYQGGGIELDYVALLLEKTTSDTELSNAVHIWTTESCTALPPLPNGIITTDCQHISSALALLQANVTPKLPLNLLTEQYSPQQQGGKHWQAWLPAAAIALLAVLLQYGIVLNEYWQNTAQLAALEADNQQLFKQTFPELKRIVNIKTQAEQALLALRKNSSASKDNDYLRLLYASGEILTQDPALHLQALDFVNGVLSLQLTGNDIAQIDHFKQEMEKNNAVSVKIQAAETNANGLSAHLDISGKSS